MSTLVLSQHRFQPQALEVQPAFRLADQLRLPLDSGAKGIIYFGNRGQFFAIGTTVGRVQVA